MSPTRVPLVVTTATFMTTINSIAARMQQLIYGRRIAATRVRPPIFILGHWRSGTTLLHELIALDDRFSFPTTAQCFCPNDFLVIRWLV
ncbi:MAG: sulfotransferase, partial [Actinomycetota bacterium]|nr:sulfotransferase [Actinomycetota bacterium]